MRGAAAGVRFDEQGEVVSMRVVIVWGPPASGKTTYVRKHMTVGDLVVDLDLIKQAISMAGKTEAGDNLLPTALRIREMLYQLVARREVGCDTAWIVASLPRRAEREELKLRLRAELVQMRASMQECISRALADPERLDKELQARIIERWFSQYE